MNDAIIRSAVQGDMPAVAAIYAHYVEGSVATFETEVPDVAAWLQKLAGVREGGWPFLIAERDGALLGYAYVSPWRTRPAYRHTVEDSVYVVQHARGSGLGKVLLGRLMDEASSAGACEVIAVIADSGDPASMRLHEAAGFSQNGRLRGVGVKHGRTLDTVLMQRSLTRVKES